MAHKVTREVYFRGLDLDPFVLPLTPDDEPPSELDREKAYVELRALLHPGEVLGVGWKAEGLMGPRRALIGDLEDFRAVLDTISDHNGKVTSFFGASTRRPA